MKNIVQIILPLLLIISCSNKLPENFYTNLDFPESAKNYYQDTLAPPPKPSIIAHFDIVLPVIREEDNFLIRIENLGGKLLYEEYYSGEYKSYAHFLEALSLNAFYIPTHFVDKLKFTMKIDSNYYGIIKPDDQLESEYKTKGFQYILDKYLEDFGVQKKMHEFRLLNQDPKFNYNYLYKIMYDNEFVGSSDCLTGIVSYYKFIEK